MIRNLKTNIDSSIWKKNNNTLYWHFLIKSIYNTLNLREKGQDRYRYQRLKNVTDTVINRTFCESFSIRKNFLIIKNVKTHISRFFSYLFDAPLAFGSCHLRLKWQARIESRANIAWYFALLALNGLPAWWHAVPSSLWCLGGWQSCGMTLYFSENVSLSLQCCGSMPFWCGSGSADPCLWLMDRDPAIFITDLQDANKKLIEKKFFCILLFECTCTLFFKDKKSKRSHKTVEIKVFLTTFA